MVCWIRRWLPILGARVRIPLLDRRKGWGTYVPCYPSVWEADSVTGAFYLPRGKGIVSGAQIRDSWLVGPSSWDRECPGTPRLNLGLSLSDRGRVKEPPLVCEE